MSGSNYTASGQLAGFSNLPCARTRGLQHVASHSSFPPSLASSTSPSQRWRLATVAIMDRASQVLAQGVPIGVPNSYRTLADHNDIPRSIFYYYIYK